LRAISPCRNREVDADEGVGVAVEDGRDPLLFEELDVLEPVEVFAGSRREEVDVLDLGDVLLVREAPAGEILGVDLNDLLGLFRGHQSSAPAYSAGWSGR
jgi:hypothetical protein